MTGLYIHIPFCKRRCVYCGFYSTTLLSHRQWYVDALCREMTLRPHPTLSSIYLGGGTPSQLTTRQLYQIFDSIARTYPTLPGDVEVTMECNPDDVTKEYAQAITALPINRVSLGVQTFSDERLRFLNRRHSAIQAVKAVDCLRQAGVRNISIDLMFGFPNQTVDEWVSDVKMALALHVEHISAYSLMYEEGTPLYNLKKAGQVEDIDDELYIIMYKTLVERLKASGYQHYEISNFSLDGYESQHNSSYWNGTPYIGLGAAAHSFDIISRQYNVPDLHRYIEAIESDEVPAEREMLSNIDRYNDLVTTALRTCNGIDLDALESEYGEEFRSYLLLNAKPYLARGLLVVESGRIHLTMDGIVMSDSVMSDLIKL